MKSIRIVASCKKGATIAKFSITPPLDLSVSKTFINIDQAADAPLVKQLFFLPFVKKVSLDNSTLIVERFDILDWKDVIDEVGQEIQKYLNEGGKINAQTDLKKIPVTVYAESTPNPNVMKFVANKMLVETVFEFKSIEDTISSPLAAALFQFPFVHEVFLDANYISINKKEGVDWETIVMEIREFIRVYIEDGKTVISAKAPVKERFSSSATPLEELDEISQEIVKIIDDYIKPAVASDGGNILFDNYNSEDKSVQVVLQGACSGCPSSTITLKNGIETMLKEMLPGKVATVSALNG